MIYFAVACFPNMTSLLICVSECGCGWRNKTSFWNGRVGLWPLELQNDMPKTDSKRVVAVEMVVAKLWLVVNSMKFNGGFLEWGYPKSWKSWMMTHQTSWPFRLPYHRVDINKQIVKQYQFVGFPVRYVYNMRMYCISMFTFIQIRVCIHRICLPPTCCK